jgi:hypothetical protein
VEAYFWFKPYFSRFSLPLVFLLLCIPFSCCLSRENQRPKGKSQPFGYGSASFPFVAAPTLCSRANPLGMALLVFPAQAAGKGYGSASFPAALVKPKAKGSSPWFSLLRSSRKTENQRPKAAVAEPTLWVWLC